MAKKLFPLTACFIIILAICAPSLMAQDNEPPTVTPEMEKELLGALEQIKVFIGRENAPDTKAVAPQKKIIDKHKELFGHNKEIMAAAMDLVQTYDQEKGPLFVARDGWDRKPSEADLHWTIYHVMQYIFDYAYTADNIEKHEELLRGFKFGSHTFFPGPVAAPASETVTYKAQIDATSPNNYPTFERLGGPRRPTGAYVAPGTIVTVKFPGFMVNNGYKIRVGAHSWDNSKKKRVTRLARVSHAYAITNQQIKLAHPLGGAIYIEVPEGADDGIVEIEIQGAVRSPLFAATRFHQTTLDEWRQVERHREAPWADFHTDKFMMQVPTMWISNLMDPVKLMADWDKACDAQNELFGQPLIKTRHTHYLQVDLQNRGRAFFPGYPTCNDRYDPDKAASYGGYANHYLVRGPQYAPSHVFHEQGHAFFCPKYPGERESVVNLPHVAIWNRKFGYSLNDAFSASRAHPEDTRHTLDNTAIAWMCINSFAKDEPMKNYEKKYQWKGHAKYVDIARLFGWDVLGKYWKSFNQEVAAGTYKGRHGYSNDEITIRKCRAAGVDLRPLLRFWGIHADDPDALAKQIADENLPPSAKIYDSLVHYKSLVPKDNKTFRKFTQMWWQKQPSPKGYTTERNHAAYWDSYNKETATKLRGLVQQTIDRYFPNGRPRL